MTIALTCTPVRCSAFALDRERRSSRQAPSPPSTTCLENFSLPGLLIVTTHFDLLNSSEANSIIRAGGGRDSGRGGDRLHRLPPCWCGSSAYQVRPPSARIGSFLRASHALAVDTAKALRSSRYQSTGEGAEMPWDEVRRLNCAYRRPPGLGGASSRLARPMRDLSNCATMAV